MAFVSPREIQRRRALSAALSQQASSPQAIARGGRSPLFGIANVLRQFGAGRGEFLANEQERGNVANRQSALANALRGGGVDLGALTTSEDPELQQLGLQESLQERMLNKRLAAQQAGLAAPSAVREFQFFEGLDPERQQQFKNLKRQQQFLNLGDRFVAPSTVDPTQTAASFEIGLKPQDVPEQAAAKASAVKQAQEDVRFEAGKRAQKTQRETNIDLKESNREFLDTEIDEAGELANIWTTGLIGSQVSGIPGTPAFDLSAKLDTIKANIGFDRLQQMRDSSPTGGALGQVSERENLLLQSVWGNLTQSQSPAQFKSNLQKVKKQVRQSWERVSKAYETDFGEPLPNSPISKAKPDEDVLTKEEREELKALEAEFGR